MGVWLVRAVPTLSDPPTGAHAWRETDGLIVARNYCLERAPFLEPRVNNRGDTDGRTGLEFPLLNYLAGRIGCASGDVVTPWRVLSLLFALLLVASVWQAGRALFGPFAGLAAVIACATSPLTPYFSRTTQPDMASAGLAALAVAVAATSARLPWTVLSFLLVGMSALLKLPGAVYLLPVILLSFRGRRRSTPRVVGALLLAALAMVPAAAWYAHARRLQHENGIENFGLTRTVGQLLAEWQIPKVWLRDFVQFPFDVWVFPGAMALLVAVLFWRGRRTPWEVAALGVTALAYLLLCGYSGAHHTYYGVMLLPAFSPMIGWASAEVLAAGRGKAAVLLACGVGLALAWQIHRDRSFWASHRAEWASLEAFSRREFGPQGRTRIVVFSDGSPQMFWFTGQIGRFQWLESPVLGPRDDYAVVDRSRISARAVPVEAALVAAGCQPVFESAVGWICRAPVHMR